MMLRFEDWKNKTRKQHLELVWGAFQLSAVKIKTQFRGFFPRRKISTGHSYNFQGKHMYITELGWAK